MRLVPRVFGRVSLEGGRSLRLAPRVFARVPWKSGWTLRLVPRAFPGESARGPPGSSQRTTIVSYYIILYHIKRIKTNKKLDTKRINMLKAIHQKNHKM